MDPKKIDRINELAKKKKTEGLTPEEKSRTSKNYVRSTSKVIVALFVTTSKGSKIVDEEGNDVTPEKLRQVQREKGLHGRSLDDPNS